MITFTIPRKQKMIFFRQNTNKEGENNTNFFYCNEFINELKINENQIIVV